MSVVPRHPDDRPGPPLGDLPSLAAFGERLVASDGVRGRGAGRLSSFAAGALGVLVALGTFTGAAAVALTAATGSPVPSFARGDDTGVFPEPGTSRVAELRAPDPANGPPWSVRIGRSTNGLVCTGVGQVDGSVFGIEGLDGRFRETPPVGNDACGPAPSAESPVVSLRAFTGPRVDRPSGATTVVFGSGGRKLAGVAIRTGEGGSRSVPHDANGTFVVAFPGWPEGVTPRVSLAWSDGRATAVELGPKGVVADPSGRFGWTTEPVFRVHIREQATPTGCVRAIGARVTRGRRTAIACVPLDGPRASIARVVAPFGAGTRRAVMVRANARERVVVRWRGRAFPLLRTTTAGRPRRVMRQMDGRPDLGPDPVRGPHAALAMLPSTAIASDVVVSVRRGGRTERSNPIERGAR